MAFIDLAVLADLLATRSTGPRLIVAVAGAPGSGKSTLAKALADLLNAKSPGTAAILPMDGYHYDDLLLVPMGLRPRKGAPATFDVAGLRHILTRLRTNDEPSVAVPVFDRDIEIARAGARLIRSEISILIVEGNYLLLDFPPWPTLKPLFDVTVMLDVPEQTLRDRLTKRWQHYNLSPADIARKLHGNDMPNGRVVRDQSVAADYSIAN